MKIAVITIHRVTNYGAALQAFATKAVLSRFGEVHTIDYQNTFLDRHMHLLRFELNRHGFKKLAHDLLNLNNRYKLLKKFNKFIEEHLNLTANLTTHELANGKAGGFDVYICGSDQIWNPAVVSRKKEIDTNYFLSFADKGAAKFSYASSMGNYRFDEDEIRKVQMLLKDFRAISTREKDGQLALSKILPHQKIDHVLDPTLLLNKNQWLGELGIDSDPAEDEYILVYSVPRTELLKKAVRYFKQKLNIRVLAIDKMLFPMEGVDTQIGNAGPKEFLNLFNNATFVVTDSFHGTCFSLIFEKPFACIAANERANRQESLLGLLKIKNRILYKEEDFKNFDMELEYSDNLRGRLDKIRQNSLNFIEGALHL